MCGIVGLFLKNQTLEPRLGEFLAAMLVTMTDRGPDSAGFAIYGIGQAGRIQVTVRGGDLDTLQDKLQAVFADAIEVIIEDSHAIISAPEDAADALADWLVEERPDLTINGTGRRIRLYKEVGAPADVSQRLKLVGMQGTHGVGHTRMATESAVTVAGAHPFSTGPDQCLVHNGSLSNHSSLRRVLTREGASFRTENDSEVAAAYLSWRMREGASLAEALEASLADLDGFFTFVVGTENGFAVLRDPIACKPAVMAETDDYVAFASEYRALAGLPGIETAAVFEPEPARVYAWERAA